VRVAGPVRWTQLADGPAAEVPLLNGSGESRTMLVLVALHDSAGERLAVADAVVAELAAGEVRTLVRALPAGWSMSGELRAWLEPLVPVP
jgi:hypothetical protein